jgi:hypothetical protein
MPVRSHERRAAACIAAATRPRLIRALSARSRPWASTGSTSVGVCSTKEPRQRDRDRLSDAVHRLRYLRQGMPRQRLRSGTGGGAADSAAGRLPDLFPLRDLLSGRCLVRSAEILRKPRSRHPVCSAATPKLSAGSAAGRAAPTRTRHSVCAQPPADSDDDVRGCAIRTAA